MLGLGLGFTEDLVFEAVLEEDFSLAWVGCRVVVKFDEAGVTFELDLKNNWN